MTEFESLPAFVQLPSERFVQRNLGMIVVSNRADQLTAEHPPAATMMKSLLISLSLTCSYGLAKAEKQRMFSTETT
jgi:hypothetical protein